MNLASRSPFRFIMMMSIVSLFADMTYEGARSVTGPFLASLGATGLIVGIVAGFGELVGFGLRYASGVLADRTGRYWFATFAGYAINLLAVPALALTRSWPVAAALIVGERIGRGVRKPTANAMVSYAGSQLGQGWVFGFREAMDQTGATVGPLVVALIIYLHGGFSKAFAVLLIPAALALVALAIARRQYPNPRELDISIPQTGGSQRKAFWIYTIGGAFLAAGFADFALVSFHLSKTHVISNTLIPVLYACAMLVGAATAPFFGRVYDKYGIAIVIAAFFVAAFFAPLVFFGSFWFAVAGIVLWGLGMAAQDALLPSVIASLAPPDKRATALGTFDGVYGVAWFAGSIALGALYDRNIGWLVVFSLVLQIAGGLPMLYVASRSRRD
jgi:MFS family permease